ncbi:MAG TPA: hypothetical protein VGM56_32420, partial [Byssovorax sp.]|jgi:hypothetical protein
VHPHEKPTTRAPWHEPGGEWTFFEATTAKGARFGFGFRPPDPNGQPFTFGKGLLTVADADDGARFVEGMASVLGAKVPPPRARTPLAIKPISLAFLGVDAHHDGTGFGGRGGGWTATKLFLQRPGLGEAELYFNFNLAKKEGHFAVKDDDYKDAAVAFFAGELRDGPRPRRTAATEPSMSEAGPHIEWLRRVEGTEPTLTAKRDGVIVWRASLTGPSTIVVSALADGKETELAKVAATRGAVAWANGWGVVVESLGEAGVLRASDPVRVTVVGSDGATHDITARVGIKAFVERRAAAPDGSLVLVNGEVPSDDTTRRRHALYVVDAAANVRGPVDLGDGWLEIVGFDRGLAIVRKTDLGQLKAPPKYASFDLATLAVRPIELPPTWARRGASPDGARAVACLDGELVVAAEKGEARRFHVFDEDKGRYEDGPECAEWVGDHALLYRGVTNGLIDARTMKLTALAEGDEDLGSVMEVAPPYVVVARDTTVRVGRVVDGP